MEKTKHLETINRKWIINIGTKIMMILGLEKLLDDIHH